MCVHRVQQQQQQQQLNTGLRRVAMSIRAILASFCTRRVSHHDVSLAAAAAAAARRWRRQKWSVKSAALKCRSWRHGCRCVPYGGRYCHAGPSCAQCVTHTHTRRWGAQTLTSDAAVALSVREAARAAEVEGYARRNEQLRLFIQKATA